MKKQKLVVLGASAAMMMMAMTACSTKTTEATVAPSTIVEATTTESESETTEEAETTTEEETTEASAAGAVDESGKFVAANGKFEITLPEGWTLDPSSDENFATFLSADGDYVEVEYASENVASLVEELPETVEEYKSWVIRDDASAEFTNYNVENTENGQNYQYAIRYNGADAETKYMSINSSYDLSANQYLNVTAVVISEGEEAIKAVDDIMASYKMIK